MDIKSELQRFLNLYQTTGWLVVIIGGAILIQGIIFLLTNAIIGQPELYDSIISYLVIPSSIRSFIFQPWSLATYPFFWEQLGSNFLRLLFGTAFIWLFGRIYQQLLGDQSLKRIVILAIPLIGLLSILIIALFELPGRGEIPIDGVTYLMIFLAVATATLVPDYPIQLFLFGQVALKWIAGLLVVFQLAYTLLTPPGITVIIAAALGFLHVYLLKDGTDVTELIWSYYQDKDTVSKPVTPKMKVKYGGKFSETETAMTNRKKGDNLVPQELIDKLLDKINEYGYESLSREEKELLFKASSQREDD